MCIRKQIDVLMHLLGNDVLCRKNSLFLMYPPSDVITSLVCSDASGVIYCRLSAANLAILVL